VNLPQFNGYFKSATMSQEEYPNDKKKKPVQNLHKGVQARSSTLDERS
jgi:hypothetical protein